MPYSKAVLKMLPTTPHIDQSLPKNKGRRPIVHEPINDLPVHPATRQQLFVPVAESRQFTRVDAGKAFDDKLLPADARIPHPELVDAARDEGGFEAATEGAREGNRDVGLSFVFRALLVLSASDAYSRSLARDLRLTPLCVNSVLGEFKVE